MGGNWDGWREYSGPVKEQSRPMRAGVPGREVPRSPTAAKRSKYGATPTVVDGIRFDSKKEAERYGELKIREQAGDICGLEVQPRFTLYVMTTGQQEPGGYSVQVGEYRADFRYAAAGAVVVEDVKSTATRTPLYRLKKKMVEAIYGITVVEV